MTVPGIDEGLDQCFAQVIRVCAGTDVSNDPVWSVRQGHRLVVESLLGSEVVAHQRGVHPGFTSNGPQAHRLIITSQEQGPGGRQNRRSCCPGLASRAAARRSGAL